MTEKKISYSDLSKKQLQNLKEIYIQKKVNGMSQKELKDFVLEIISHQIHETIGKEEELEAWQEMESFFGDQFSHIILELQERINDNDDNFQKLEKNNQTERLELLERQATDVQKKDMWND